MYSHYPIWNSIIVLSIKDSTACTVIAIYIKDKPITSISRSFCGIYADIIGFILMEERDIITTLVSVFILKLFYILKKVLNVKIESVKIAIILLYSWHIIRVMCLNIFICFLYYYLMVYNRTVILHVCNLRKTIKAWHCINILY